MASPPPHSTNTWYQGAAFRFVVHPTNERKNFWFAQESWAAAELTSPRQARAAWVQQQVLRLRAQHHHWPTRNRDTKGRLIRLRPTRGHPLWCNDGRGRPRFMHMFPGPFPWFKDAAKQAAATTTST